MKNPFLDEIKRTICRAAHQKYGYCGLADSENFAMLNSGDDRESFVIRIEDRSEAKPAKETAA